MGSEMCIRDRADEAIHIGASPASQSYIDIKKVVNAAKSCGAEAIHPGYGFLSENSKFADALSKEKIAFIGPPKGAIESMGDKITSKKIAQEASFWLLFILGLVILIISFFDVGETLSDHNQSFLEQISTYPSLLRSK